MKQPEKFIEVMTGIMYDWGGDAPPEAFWNFNLLVEFYIAETGNEIGQRVDERYEYFTVVDSIIEEIKAYEHIQ